MQQRTYLELEAFKHGLSVKDFVIRALKEGGGTAYGASQVIGISPASVDRAMKHYGLTATVEKVVTVIESEPS